MSLLAVGATHSTRWITLSLPYWSTPDATNMRRMCYSFLLCDEQLEHSAVRAVSQYGRGLFVIGARFSVRSLRLLCKRRGWIAQFLILVPALARRGDLVGFVEQALRLHLIHVLS